MDDFSKADETYADAGTMAPGSTRTFGQMLADEVSGVMDDTRTVLGAPGKALLDLATDPTERKASGDLLRAAFNATRMNDQIGAEERAYEKALDLRIAMIREQTGMELQNPVRGGYSHEATNRIGEQTGMDPKEVTKDAWFRSALGVFEEKTEEARLKFPDKAGALQFYQSVDEQARAIARAAHDDLVVKQEGVNNPLLRFTAGVGGAVGAALADPVQLAGMAFGAGPAMARTLVGRMAQTVLREAVLNGALQAVQEPFVQAWREKIGIASGVDQALENIAFSAGLGGAFGGVAQGLREGMRTEARALQRVLAGTADPADVSKVLGSLLRDMPEETSVALKQAQGFMEDSAAFAVPPRGVDVHAHMGALDSALRHMDNPDYPPPMPILGVDPSVKQWKARDVAALTSESEAAQILRAAEDGSAGLLETAKFLRDTPEAFEVMNAHLGARMQDAAGLAVLSDEAFGKVLAGDIDGSYAALVGRMVPDRPELHAGLLNELAQADPKSMRQAHTVLADSLARFEPKQYLQPLAAPVEPGAQDASQGLRAPPDAKPSSAQPAKNHAIDKVVSPVFSEADRHNLLSDFTSACGFATP